MTIDTDNPGQHDQVRELLPWYVNGSLSIAEQQKIESHLDDCKACRNDLAGVEAIDSAINQEGLAVLPPKPDVDGFLARLDVQPATGRRKAFVIGALAAAAVIFVSIATGFLVASIWLQTPEPAVFQTLTSRGDPSSFDYVLEIRFHNSTGAAGREAVFDDIEARSVLGPDEQGTYRVMVRLPAYTLAELDAFCRSIEQRFEVDTARTVALQLPVEEP